jgi:hypothetical protein
MKPMCQNRDLTLSMACATAPPSPLINSLWVCVVLAGDVRLTSLLCEKFEMHRCQLRGGASPFTIAMSRGDVATALEILRLTAPTALERRRIVNAAVEMGYGSISLTQMYSEAADSSTWLWRLMPTVDEMRVPPRKSALALYQRILPMGTALHKVMPLDACANVYACLSNDVNNVRFRRSLPTMSHSFAIEFLIVELGADVTICMDAKGNETARVRNLLVLLDLPLDPVFTEAEDVGIIRVVGDAIFAAAVADLDAAAADMVVGANALGAGREWHPKPSTCQINADLTFVRLSQAMITTLTEALKTFATALYVIEKEEAQPGSAALAAIEACVTKRFFKFSLLLTVFGDVAPAAKGTADGARFLVGQELYATAIADALYDSPVPTALLWEYGDLEENSMLHRRLSDYDKSFRQKTGFHLGALIDALPPDIAQMSNNDMLVYLRSIGNDDGEDVYRLKLMVVGYSGVGKTTLLNALQLHAKDACNAVNLSGDAGTANINQNSEKEDGMSPKTTDGIRVVNWSTPHPDDAAKRIDALCWDFAGQQTYYSCHQVFLTLRSTYLVVFNSRTTTAQDTESLDFWLDSLSAFGSHDDDEGDDSDDGDVGDGDGSGRRKKEKGRERPTVVLVATHRDLMTGHRPPVESILADARAKHSKTLNLIGCHWVSCCPKAVGPCDAYAGVSTLKSEIMRNFVSQRHACIRVRSSWLQLEKRLKGDTVDPFPKTAPSTTSLLSSSSSSLSDGGGGGGSEVTAPESWWSKQCAFAGIDVVERMTLLRMLNGWGSVLHMPRHLLLFPQPDWLMSVLRKVRSVASCN